MGTYAWNILYSKTLPAKIPPLALPSGRPGRAQSGRTPEFGYDTLYKWMGKTCHGKSIQKILKRIRRSVVILLTFNTKQSAVEFFVHLNGENVQLKWYFLPTFFFKMTRHENKCFASIFQIKHYCSFLFCCWYQCFMFRVWSKNSYGKCFSELGSIETP